MDAPWLVCFSVWPVEGGVCELWYCLGGTLGRAERIPVTAISPEREVAALLVCGA